MLQFLIPAAIGDVGAICLPYCVKGNHEAQEEPLHEAVFAYVKLVAAFADLHLHHLPSPALLSRDTVPAIRLRWHEVLVLYHDMTAHLHADIAGIICTYCSAAHKCAACHRQRAALVASKGHQQKCLNSSAVTKTQ